MLCLRLSLPPSVLEAVIYTPPPVNASVFEVLLLVVASAGPMK